MYLGITVTYKKLFKMENFASREDIVQTERSIKINSLVQWAHLVHKSGSSMFLNVNYVHLVITVNLKLS